jgi:hypothetical protein
VCVRVCVCACDYEVVVTHVHGLVDVADKVSQEGERAGFVPSGKATRGAPQAFQVQTPCVIECMCVYMCVRTCVSVEI